MISENLRETIRTLFSTGTAKKEIARLLNINIKTVRSILNSNTATLKERADKIEVSDELLQSLYISCRGMLTECRKYLRKNIRLKLVIPH
ncbi:MAG: hypothetical protein L3J12_09275 [Spirochaetales bacterium]|nr:hypothetical protein [Spirochaetales bacterium]